MIAAAVGAVAMKRLAAGAVERGRTAAPTMRASSPRGYLSVHFDRHQNFAGQAE